MTSSPGATAPRRRDPLRAGPLRRALESTAWILAWTAVWAGALALHESRDDRIRLGRPLAAAPKAPTRWADRPVAGAAVPAGDPAAPTAGGR